MRLIRGRIIDEDGNEITGYGIPGELCIRGPTVFIGYFGDPQATRAGFDSDGYLKTGDITFYDQETKDWFVVDRKKAGH
jgi:long-subunit acyl-CoA synthetase (AMP-forming)